MSSSNGNNQHGLPTPVAQNPSGNNVPLQVDNDGNLLVSIDADAEGNLPVTVSSGLVTETLLPNGATQLVAVSGNEANTNAVATLAGVAGKTTHITGFDVTASGATAASVVEVAVAGPAVTLTYIFAFPAGVAIQAAPLSIRFNPPIAASAADTAITVTLPAGGSGAAYAAVNAFGFQQ